MRSHHNPVDSAGETARKNRYHFRREESQFLQSGVNGNHDDDRDRKVSDILLTCEPVVNGGKGVAPMIG